MSATPENLSAWNHEKVQAEISKLMGETAKLNAETAKINREKWWYALAPISTLMGAGGVLVGAGIALAKLIGI